MGIAFAEGFTTTNRDQNAHSSIKVSLPVNVCGEVRDIIAVLSALEDAYNQLSLWHLLVSQTGGSGRGPDNPIRQLREIKNVAEAVAPQDRLCLAAIEIELPAYAEIVGMAILCK